MIALANFVSSAAVQPRIEWTRGYSNGGCEAHPHAGVQLADGGFLLVGDSVCYNTSHSKLRRAILVVRTREDGGEAWQRTLGEIGFNYGKYGVELSDGSLLLATSMSLLDTAGAAAGFPYVERRVLFACPPRAMYCTAWSSTRRLQTSRAVATDS